MLVGVGDRGFVGKSGLILGPGYFVTEGSGMSVVRQRHLSEQDYILPTMVYTGEVDGRK